MCLPLPLPLPLPKRDGAVAAMCLIHIYFNILRAFPARFYAPARHSTRAAVKRPDSRRHHALHVNVQLGEQHGDDRKISARAIFLIVLLLHGPVATPLQL
jgi:hypothetical protein